jgi:hypothetical protein
MPDPIVIANRPLRARILAVFWIVETVVGLAFATTGMRGFGASENGLAGVMIFGGLLLSMVGVVLAATATRIALLEGPAIVMNAKGLIDRRLCEQVIPWKAISWKVIFNGRAYSLQFDVKPPWRKELKVYWQQRLMGRINRMFKYPELTVATLGTGLDAHDLAARMKRFKAPRD